MCQACFIGTYAFFIIAKVSIIHAPKEKTVASCPHELGFSISDLHTE
jgi:hypothetical protein